MYYPYIITNKNKTTLYVGMTNNLLRRLKEHQNGVNKGFSKRYNCCYLVYYERFNKVTLAIAREKENKNWRREKKNALISQFNPEWMFLQYSG